MQKTILVMNGTGMLGHPVSRSLKDAGFGVRVMTRNLQKARKMFDKSFEIFEGDPTDSNCVEEALDGCYGVHISLPSEVEQQVAEIVAKVARKHGVERITYISGATVAEEHCWAPIANHKFLAEQAIRESGIPYTIFCPTWVMEIMPMFVNQGRAAVFGRQPFPYRWVAAADLARMVSAAYQIEASANKRFRVLGPEAIHMQEALRRYCAAFHPEITKITSMPFWLVKLLAALTRNQALKDAGELFYYFDKIGEQSSDPGDDICTLGAPTTTLDHWLERRKQ